MNSFMKTKNVSIGFVNVSGYYQPDPEAFVHVWNQCSNVPEVIDALNSAWQNFKQSDNYYAGTNSKGKKTDPKLSITNLQEKAKSFRKKGVYMKDMPRHSTSKYDWDNLVKISMTYKNPQKKFNF
tara:strand:- start:3 stop:377 length:375 start_codon:yes stop_codon:yes gene_type:complete